MLSARHGVERHPSIGIVDELRETEIENLGEAVVRHHQVLGLEIAMHDARIMCFRKTVGDRRRDLQRASRRQRSSLQDFSERLALDELHADEGPRLGLTKVVNRDNRRMVERGRRPGFEFESPHSLGVACAIGRQELERDVTAEPGVMREIHLAHATGSQKRTNDKLPEAHAGRQGHCRYCAAARA